MPAPETATVRGMGGWWLRAPAAVALTLAGWFGVLLLVFSTSSSYVPNPWLPDHPDDWRETLGAVGILLLIVAATAGVLALAAVLLVRGARLRFVPVVIAVTWALTLTLVVRSIVADRDQILAAPSCGDFRFRQADWRSADDRVRGRAALGLASCESLRGMTERQVRGALGVPSSLHFPTRWDRTESFTYEPYLSIEFDPKTGRASETYRLVPEDTRIYE